MSEPKFTSWHVEKCGGRIEINMGDYSIALRDSTENMELAVFIAAAPEMYTVLQHFADLINRANAGSETDDLRIFEDVVLIEQVLKKARGE